VFYGIPFAQESPATAPFGHLYLHKIPLAFHCWNVSLAEEFRLNLDDFNEAYWEEFTGYID
jgi:hypothetical protein